MKQMVLAVGMAAGLACAATTASAAVFNYSAVIDLDPSMIQSPTLLHVPLPGGPIPLSLGDTLQGTITFANNGRITVFDNPGLGELITGSFAPDPGTTLESDGSFALLGVQGDYLLPPTITSSHVGGSLAFFRRTNYTNSSFSFRGVSFSLTYVSTGDQLPPFTSHVTPFSLDVLLAPSAISEGPVPEPATWALMLLGFAAAGQGLRTRRRRRDVRV